MYKCCDKHRMFIDIKQNSDNLYVESIVFNTEGLVGQIIGESKFYEVLLLTDISHSLPIKLNSSNFFCNAKGSGRSNILFVLQSSCMDSRNRGNQIFYTSGLGGIYPKDIEVGYVSSIEIIDSTQTNIEIKLLSQSLNGDMFGVLSTDDEFIKRLFLIFFINFIDQSVAFIYKNIHNYSFNFFSFSFYVYKSDKNIAL